MPSFLNRIIYYFVALAGFLLPTNQVKIKATTASITIKAILIGNFVLPNQISKMIEPIIKIPIQTN